MKGQLKLVLKKQECKGVNQDLIRTSVHTLINLHSPHNAQQNTLDLYVS
jgi:hypothetical protein